jgi:hypothetical protein
MLKKSASVVLASFRPSTYPRGYASALHSLRPSWTVILSILRGCIPMLQTCVPLNLKRATKASSQPAGGTKSLLQLLGFSVILSGSLVAFATETPAPHQSSHVAASACPRSGHDQAGSARSTPSAGESVEFESVQIETSELTRYEQFFDGVLRAPVVQRMDHPQVDSLRGYCYRGVLIVVRQDLRTPRPTGWVQINFAVSNVAAVQEELEGSVHASSLYERSEEERAKVVRFRLKPDVMRGDRKAIRLEVYGPEGFMIGFDQYK